MIVGALGAEKAWPNSPRRGRNKPAQGNALGIEGKI
jgi:hypothetical protein